MMRKFLVVLLPLTPSNCVAVNTRTTGLYTIAKFQSVKNDTNETQYQIEVLKVHIKFYSPTSFTNYNIAVMFSNMKLNMCRAGL
jgi:hypothetical protein